MNGKIIFILSVVCMVFASLYFRSCTTKPNVKDEKRDKEVDSLTHKAIADSLKGRHDIDSVNSVVVVLSNEKDSLEGKLELTQSALHGRDSYIEGIIGRSNKAKANHDTVAELAGCDSLKAAYPAAKQLVVKYINTNDSLIKLNGQIVAQKDVIIKRLDGLYTESNNSLFEISRQYGNQGVELKKAQKSGNKRWGIGPGVGVAYDGTFKPVVEIGIHYDVFRF